MKYAPRAHEHTIVTPRDLGMSPPPRNPRQMRKWARAYVEAQKPETTRYAMRVELLDGDGVVVEFDDFVSALLAEQYISDYVSTHLFDSALADYQGGNAEPSGAAWMSGAVGERTVSWPFNIRVRRIEVPETCLYCGIEEGHSPLCLRPSRNFKP